MIILYSYTPQRKRKRAEEGCSQCVKEETLAGKKRKGAVKRPKRITQAQKKATELATSFITKTFDSCYEVGDKLGEGCFGSVYEGRRVSDGLQVAIKFVWKWETGRCLYSPVESKVVPVEVALLQIMSQPPICKNIVQLIEWFDELDRYILILECPHPCVDLESFMENLGNCLDEETARAVMVQVVEAASQCSKRGVLHRDMKRENFLINTDTSEVKLIDFGCGDLIKTTEYDSYAGKISALPFVENLQLKARFCTVLLRFLLVGSITLILQQFGRLVSCCSGWFVDTFPLLTVWFFNIKDGVSEECYNLIEWCLECFPYQRPSLQQITEHEWFQCTNQA
ncbi:hypothetical protein SRHO_G00323890 [Serrasalmus rhombeus]